MATRLELAGPISRQAEGGNRPVPKVVAKVPWETANEAGFTDTQSIQRLSFMIGWMSRGD
jgi:hypothetical protein